MNLDVYLDLIFSATWYLIPIFIFSILIKSAWFKGVLGEWQVNLLIKFFLDKNQYHLIINVTLPTFIEGKEQGATQIDHIYLSTNQNFKIHCTKTTNTLKYYNLVLKQMFTLCF